MLPDNAEGVLFVEWDLSVVNSSVFRTIPLGVSCLMWMTKHSAEVYDACQEQSQILEPIYSSDKNEILYKVLTSSTVRLEALEEFTPQPYSPMGLMPRGSERPLKRPLKLV